MTDLDDRIKALAPDRGPLPGPPAGYRDAVRRARRKRLERTGGGAALLGVAASAGFVLHSGGNDRLATVAGPARDGATVHYEIRYPDGWQWSAARDRAPVEDCLREAGTTQRQILYVKPPVYRAVAQDAEQDRAVRACLPPHLVVDASADPPAPQEPTAEFDLRATEEQSPAAERCAALPGTANQAVDRSGRLSSAVRHTFTVSGADNIEAVTRCAEEAPLSSYGSNPKGFQTLTP